jgi:hypothetical protein
MTITFDHFLHELLSRRLGSAHDDGCLWPKHNLVTKACHPLKNCHKRIVSMTKKCYVISKLSKKAESLVVLPASREQVGVAGGCRAAGGWLPADCGRLEHGWGWRGADMTMSGRWDLHTKKTKLLPRNLHMGPICYFFGGVRYYKLLEEVIKCVPYFFLATCKTHWSTNLFLLGTIEMLGVSLSTLSGQPILPPHFSR